MVYKLYFYGMRSRGFRNGNQPLTGLRNFITDRTGKYHTILVYSRRLDDKDLEKYDLEFIKEEKAR